MRRFLVKLGITALFLLAVACALDVVITHNLKHSDARMFHTYNAIYSDTLKCDAVVMGSSRGQVQYDVRILDSIAGINCYNLGVDGRCIDAEVVIYNTYRQHASKPRLIIQNIDWGTLQMSNGYEREQYLPYLNKDDLYELTRKSEKFSWADRWLPLKRYAGYHNVIFEGLGLSAKMARPNNIYKGYIAVDETWNGIAFDKIDTIGFESDPEAVAIFDHYLAQCRKECVQVVMVFAPFYIGATHKMGLAEDSMFALYQSFADKYNYPILNYTHDSICYDTQNFYNASHLNRHGAKLFSSKLAKDLIKLLDTLPIYYGDTQNTTH